MSWFNLSEIFREEEVIPSVSGDDKISYRFLYTRSQWMRGSKIEHEVEGNIDMGISKYDENTFHWSIDFKNVECRKKTNFILEFYIFWDYVKRADFSINIDGQISYDFKAFDLNTSYREKVEKVSQYLDGNRRKNLINGLKKIKDNPVSVKRLFELNPVIQLLCKELDFYHRSLKNSSESPINAYKTTDILRDYFGEGYHLPLKKFSALDKSNGEAIIGSCVGGVDKEKIKKETLFRYMKKLAGKVAIGSDLLLDYSEFYQYNPETFLNTGSLERAETYVQTIIADAWYLEEQTLLIKN